MGRVVLHGGQVGHGHRDGVQDLRAQVGRVRGEGTVGVVARYSIVLRYWC